MSRVALVIEGTWGIGGAISNKLRGQGYTVVATYGGDREAARTFNDSTGIPTYECDATDLSACKTCVRNVEDEHGSIEVLVTNPAAVHVRALHRMSSEEWGAVRAANLDAAFNTTRSVIEGMRSREYGRIVCVTPTPDQEALIDVEARPISEAGIINLMQSLAYENAGRGITVNAVSPGYIDTPAMRELPEKRIASEVLPRIPVGRLGSPSEVAEAVAFLVDELAGFITGSTLTINGGHKMY